MTAKDKNLNDLFLDTLKDIYYAEKQILKALPKMAKAASSDKLSAAFEKHHGETEGQVERLEQIFELVDKPARGKLRHAQAMGAAAWHERCGAPVGSDPAGREKDRRESDLARRGDGEFGRRGVSRLT
jgi:hypothetical protein